MFSNLASSDSACVPAGGVVDPIGHGLARQSSPTHATGDSHNSSVRASKEDEEGKETEQSSGP